MNTTLLLRTPDDLKINLKMILSAHIRNLLVYVFLFAVSGSLFLAPTLMAQEGIRGNLVDVRWLEKNLTNPDVLILDVSSTKLYKSNHIPGALSVDLYTWHGLREIPVADMEKLFRSWGISPGKKIVMYDQGGTYLATRLFFSLHYYGFPSNNLLILDGGLFKWQEAGFPVTQEVTPFPNTGDYAIKNINEDVRARLPEYITASGDTGNNVLVSALGADWHFGQVVFFSKPGHIPNSVLLPSIEFFNHDKTFKSPEEIKRMLAFLDIRPEQQIYTHCGGGIAASVPFFAIKFMVNYPNVKLFSESELGWLSDERELPFWTYDAPFLMRETNWLQFWAGQRIRMFGGVNVSMVDVRSAEEYNKGHVPFALNIPAGLLKSHITNPGRLTEILGPAGINASDETVIISGVGLTKESALAFVILEELGQKKVSVFIDSLDKWTRLGHELAKDTIAAEDKKNTGSLSVPTINYSGNPDRDVIISDLNSTPGIYPEVLIASGRNISSKSIKGKVVHVPYTDLLNTDGTPKAAKDILSILEKAGVPRYAELVCYSDDPGEAAVNYFILRLMGYPDIKLLVL